MPEDSAIGAPEDSAINPADELPVRIAGQVATVTLNRPAVRNALSAELRRRLRTCIAHLDADPRVRVIVLTGTDPAFCSGVDLREMQFGPTPGDLTPRSEPFIVSSTPVIGAINGPAYTGGLELALACHLLVASDRATFADTHARMGLTPGWGLTVLLPEAVGVRRARQLMLTSRPIDARTALAWGLVNEVVPHDDLGPTAQRIAMQIADGEPDAITGINRTINEQAAQRQAGAWALEAHGFFGAGLRRAGAAP